MATWSGTPYFIARALEAAGFQLDYIGPLSIRNPFWYKIKGKFFRMRGWDYINLGEEAVLRDYARQAQPFLRQSHGKILFSCGKPHLTYLDTQLPIIFFDDGSVPSITSSHPGHMRFHPKLKAKLLQSEQGILEKCFAACYMSDWAADAALKEYGYMFESKIMVLPIGPNIACLPPEKEIEIAILGRDHKNCRLLMVGVNWEHKGGSIAVAATKELRRRGVPAVLHVVGCTPPRQLPDYVRIHGFVSKKTEAGRALLAELFRESHFLILPTRAEAYGLAFVEASAHGIPSLGTAVGGVKTILHENENGWLFPFDAPPSQYADRIHTVWSDPKSYVQFCRSALRSSQTRLSWGQFGETVVRLAESAIKQLAASRSRCS